MISRILLPGRLFGAIRVTNSVKSFGPLESADHGAGDMGGAVPQPGFYDDGFPAIVAGPLRVGRGCRVGAPATHGRGARSSRQCRCLGWLLRDVPERRGHAAGFRGGHGSGAASGPPPGVHPSGQPPGPRASGRFSGRAAARVTSASHVTCAVVCAFERPK